MRLYRIVDRIECLRIVGQSCKLSSNINTCKEIVTTTLKVEVNKKDEKINKIFNLVILGIK